MGVTQSSCPSHTSPDAVIEGYDLLCHAVTQNRFAGSGRYETPVADLKTTLLVVLRLRSRVAQKITAKAVDVFVRYLGGDTSLIPEVLQRREYQEHLAETDPTNPARVFGDGAENGDWHHLCLDSLAEDPLPAYREPKV